MKTIRSFAEYLRRYFPRRKPEAWGRNCAGCKRQQDGESVNGDPCGIYVTELLRLTSLLRGSGLWNRPTKAPGKPVTIRNTYGRIEIKRGGTVVFNGGVK